MNIKLIPLQEHEKETFIRNIQIAFKKAVVEQFGPFDEEIIPWFIGGFLLLAIINSVGLIPAAVSGIMKTASKFLMVTALAAIGLNTSLTDFKKAGLKPMFYGITIDTLVTLTALIVIWCMGLM